MSDQIAALPTDAVWAIEPHAGDVILSGLKSARGMSLGGLAKSPMEVVDGIAIVSISGPMTREHSVVSLLFGGTSTMAVRDAVEAAAVDEAINAIVLRINTPGGSVSGLAELGDAILVARQSKPVIAQVAGMAASAGYYVAAHADAIYAHRMDQVGSVGTRIMLYDYSAAFAKEGVEAIPIDTGEFKSAGAMGLKITDEHKAYFQSIVDKAQAEFSAVLTSIRGLTADQLAAASDGRVHFAADAQAMGLIDGVKTERETLAALRAQFEQRSERTERMAATYQEIVAGCAGIEPSSAEDSQFICDQLAKGVEVDAAAQNWMKTLGDRAKSAREAEATAKAEAEAAKAEQAKQKAAPGVDPLEESGKATDGGESAKEQFDAAVAEKVKAGLPKSKAVSTVVRTCPDLHTAMLAEVNSGRR